MLFLFSITSFAESSYVDKIEKVSYSEFNDNTTNIESTVVGCTVTVTVSWYNEYGVYLGQTSATATYNTGTSFDCTGARLEAEKNALAQGPPVGVE